MIPHKRARLHHATSLVGKLKLFKVFCIGVKKPVLLPCSKLDYTLQPIPNLSRLPMTFLIKTTILLSLLTFSHSYGEPKRNPCEGIAELSIGEQAADLHREMWPYSSVPDPTASARWHAALRSGDLIKERQCWSKVDNRLRDNAGMSDVARNVCVAAFERTLCHMASYAVSNGMKDPKFVNSWCSTEYDLAYKAGQRCHSGQFTNEFDSEPKRQRERVAHVLRRGGPNRASPFPFVPVIFICFIIYILVAICCGPKPFHLLYNTRYSYP